MILSKGDRWEGKGGVPRVRTWESLNLGTRASPPLQETLWVSSKLKSRPVQGMPESQLLMEGEGHRLAGKECNLPVLLIFLSFMIKTHLLEPFIFTTQSVDQCKYTRTHTPA